MYPGSNLANNAGQQQLQLPADDFPWWLKFGARGAGCGGGVVAMALGVWTCLHISASCIIAGIWLILAGFIVVALEAPCCCMFVDFVQQFSNWADTRPPWIKAVGYTVLAVPDIILCAGLSTIFGSIFILIPAVLYGMMALGKKASRGEMIAHASSITDVTLVDDRGQPQDVEAGKMGGRS